VLTDFELGELAGNLRNILLMTKHNYHCADFKIQVVRENGERTFKITLIFEHNSSLEYVTGRHSSSYLLLALPD
jgi:hypothetical protein